MNTIYFVISYPFPMSIFSLGLAGNLLGLLVLFKSKRLNNIGPVRVYGFLFLMDSLNLLQMIEPILCFGFDFDITLIDRWTCLAYWYTNYAWAPVSGFLLCFISIDRYISLKWAHMKNVLKNKRNQLIYFCLVFILSHVAFSPVLFYFDIVNADTNGTSYSCQTATGQSGYIVSYMDLAVRVIVPFTTMGVFTVLVILLLFKSRERISSHYTANQNARYRRDVKFAITTVLVDLFYVFSEIPISIIDFEYEWYNKFNFNFNFIHFNKIY